MTMKIFLKNLRLEVLDFFQYFASIFTSRAVIVSASIMLGGLLGLSLAAILRIGAFVAWGTITLPLTESPITISGLAFFGGLAGLFISQGMAANRWFKNKDRANIENQVVATMAVAM